MDEQMRFVMRLKDGESMASLCREFGISRKTGYKIFERYEECGLEGLSDTDTPSLPLRQSTAGTGGSGNRGSQARETHLGSAQDPRAPAAAIAARGEDSGLRTIHAVLDRHGLVKPAFGRRTKTEGTALSDGLNPNDLWCTDYKGEFMLGDKRYCYPLTAQCRCPAATTTPTASKD